MARLPAPPHLVWRSEGPLQLASDGSRLYFRETPSSTIASALFLAALSVGAAYGGYNLLSAPSLFPKIIGVVLLLVTLAFLWVLVLEFLAFLGVTAPRSGRPILLLDNTPPGTIDLGYKTISTADIRCITTRHLTGKQIADIRRCIVTLIHHDGTETDLPPFLTNDSWAIFFAQQTAAWLRLPYAPSA